MADQTLQQFLSGVLLTQLAQSEAIKSGIPDVLGPEYERGSGQNPVGTQVQWDQITGNRQLAQTVLHMSPARSATVAGVDRKFATALGSKEEMVFDTELVLQLLNNVPLMAERAKVEMVRRFKLFRKRMDNLRVALKTLLFANGCIYVDKDGNVLPNSTNKLLTVGPGFNTANKLTKNGSGSTYNIGDWSSASTDIAGKLRGLRVANVKANGYTLSTILYGQSVPGYIQQNTTLQEYLKFNPAFNNELVTKNEIPQGFLGWKNWKPVSDANFDDQNGTNQSIFADNFLGIHPDIDTDWYDYFECGTPVPRQGVGGNLITNVENFQNLLDVVYGLFSYGEFSTGGGVVALKQYIGWYGLPMIKVIGTVYGGTCS